MWNEILKIALYVLAGYVALALTAICILCLTLHGDDESLELMYGGIHHDWEDRKAPADMEVKISGPGYKQCQRMGLEPCALVFRERELGITAIQPFPGWETSEMEDELRKVFGR